METTRVKEDWTYTSGSAAPAPSSLFMKVDMVVEFSLCVWSTTNEQDKGCVSVEESKFMTRKNEHLQSLTPIFNLGLNFWGHGYSIISPRRFAYGQWHLLYSVAGCTLIFSGLSVEGTPNEV